MQAFKALSFADKWRVSRAIYRGEAPADPRMAAAAIELAESYQRQRNTKLLRWLIPVIVVGAGGVAILGAVTGDMLQAVVFGAMALVNLGHLALNPASRPKSVARSLEASRQLVAQGR